VKITVVGAGFYGSTLAQRVAEGGYAGEVVLTDVVAGRAQGLALDLMQSRALVGFSTRVVGTEGYEQTAGSDICVITAGKPRQPGMTRADLTATNAAIVADVTRRLVECSPETVLIVVSNPLDEMTALAASVSGLDTCRVMGQAGVLDTARFRHFLAERAGVGIDEVEALTLGSHGETMVSLTSLATISGVALAQAMTPDVIAEVVARTREGGAEIVALLKTGSAYYAPAAAAEVMLRAVATDESGRVDTAAGQGRLPMAASVYLDGQYGLSGVYLGAPVRLGRSGVTEVVELALDASELEALRVAAEAVGRRQRDVVLAFGPGAMR